MTEVAAVGELAGHDAHRPVSIRRRGTVRARGVDYPPRSRSLRVGAGWHAIRMPYHDFLRGCHPASRYERFRSSSVRESISTVNALPMTIGREEAVRRGAVPWSRASKTGTIGLRRNLFPGK